MSRKLFWPGLEMLYIISTTFCWVYENLPAREVGQRGLGGPQEEEGTDVVNVCPVSAATLINRLFSSETNQGGRKRRYCHQQLEAPRKIYRMTPSRRGPLGQSLLAGLSLPKSFLTSEWTETQVSGVGHRAHCGRDVWWDLPGHHSRRMTREGGLLCIICFYTRCGQLPAPRNGAELSTFGEV